MIEWCRRVRSSCCTTTAARGRTSTCGWRKTACCVPGRWPGGLPDDPAHDRLAVAVADHDLDHATYTDEHKSIADHGWWELLDRDQRRFVFRLHGRTSVRRFALIHTGEDWLLHLTKEQP